MTKPATNVAAPMTKKIARQIIRFGTIDGRNATRHEIDVAREVLAGFTAKLNA